ncbi:MAG TPA: hypothetical protein ENK49_01315 [Gammaproteobacteria bacterium]|nr:hypothetical protein [Gammaproteobacteria bacterium]
MKRTSHAFLLATLLNLAGVLPAAARDMDEQYAVFGVGSDNCAAYLVARDRGGRAERWYHHWLAGYLSAVNNAGASTYNILGDKSMADILDWLEGYCAANPNVNFANAVADMVTLLYTDRQNMAPGKEGGWNKFTEQPSPSP